MVRSAPLQTLPEGPLATDAAEEPAAPPAAPSRPAHPAAAPNARLAKALFAPGGALAAYPGPAAAIGPGDVVLAANDAAATLLDGLLHESASELRLAIRSALGGAAAQLQPLLLPAGARAGAGEQAALDLVVLPYPDAGAALLLGRDVTLERTLRAALVESRQRYKDLVEAASDFVWETGPEGRFVFVSPGGALGYRPDELIGRRPEEFLINAEAGAADAAFPFVSRTPAAEVALWFRAANGEPASLVASCKPVLDAAGAWAGTRGACQDVTERRARDAELARLRHRERLLAYLVRTIRYEVDPRNAATAAATAALPALAAEGCRVHRQQDGGFGLVSECGAAAPAMEAELLAALAAGQDRVERATDGQAMLAVPIRHGRRLTGALVLWRTANLGAWDADDLFLVSELADQLGVALQQIASQETLATLSRIDSLTGLVNRRSFVDELEQRLAAPTRGALLYIDLDNFKPVNDRLGHARGDAVLAAVGRLMGDCFRGSDLVGRLGGDEFVAWLADIGEPAAVAKAAEILRRIEQELASLADGLPLGASIGIALHDGVGSETAEALIARADGAMYAAKRGGKRHAVVAPPATESAS